MFGANPRRDAKEATLDPGIEKMTELAKLQRMRARLPAPKEVKDALRSFVTARRLSKTGLVDTQATLVLGALHFLLDAQQANKPDLLETGHAVVNATEEPMTSTKLLADLAMVLSASPAPLSEIHVQLATRLHGELITRGNYAGAIDAAKCYVKVLSRAGYTSTARAYLLQQPAGLSSTSDALSETTDVAAEARTTIRTMMAKQGLWAPVLQGYAREDNETELVTTLQALETLGIPQTEMMLRTVLEFFIDHNRVDEIENRWALYCQKQETQLVTAFDNEAAGRLVKKMLMWCLAHDRLELGHFVVREVLEADPHKTVWDAVFVWAAGTGKGVDEISRMFSVMEAANSAETCRPDIATINALVEHAVTANDPYAAERFISLGKDRGILPDATTYTLQIDYRLRVKDTDGALIAYKNLTTMDLSSNSDVPAVNRLLIALCASKRHDFATIMNVAADLSDRKVRFEAPTVCALAKLHLERDEIADVSDLLNTHAFAYSSADRAAVRGTLLACALDPATPLARGWDTYNILRDAFDELARPERTKLMLHFFAHHERPDMAVHIFGHMRTHSRVDTQPTTDTYVQAFLAASRLPDRESLEVLHNQLKLDPTITLSTYIRNALLLGYTLCGKPRQGLQYWDDIVRSREGPSYNSILAALQACEISAFGDAKALEIWALLGRRGVEKDQRLWAAFIAALAGNGDTAGAVSTLEAGVENGEVFVDAQLAGRLYMASGSVGRLEKQKEIEAWCRGEWPEVWEKLEGMGMVENDAGAKFIKGMDRIWEP